MVIKRTHGLGNVVLLLPVLNYLASTRGTVTLVTRREWVEAFSALAPNVTVTADACESMLDLDRLTVDAKPALHRTLEFAALLGVPGEPVDSGAFPLPVPDEWRKPFLQYRNLTGFAPEAGHPSRRWPSDLAKQFCDRFQDGQLVLLGLSSEQALPGIDLRGRLTLTELFGLVSLLSCLVSLDSGLLHVAVCVGTPSIALFGGIDPRYRLRPDDKVRVLTAELPCLPCNKNETCEGRYDCMTGLSPEDVLREVRSEGPQRLDVLRLPPLQTVGAREPRS